MSFHAPKHSADINIFWNIFTRGVMLEMMSLDSWPLIRRATVTSHFDQEMSFYWVFHVDACLVNSFKLHCFILVYSMNLGIIIELRTRQRHSQVGKEFALFVSKFQSHRCLACVNRNFEPLINPGASWVRRIGTLFVNYDLFFSNDSFGLILDIA